MNFDDYEALWRAQPAPSAPSPAAAENAALLERIRKEARSFDRTIFWRDIREILVAFAVAVCFGIEACRHTDAGHVAWGRWIAAALVLGVAVILLRDRRSMPSPGGAEAPLLEQIDAALAGLRFQTRVLARVPWTYALPLTIAIAASVADSVIRERGLAGLLGAFGVAITVLGVLSESFVVWVNRRAIRRVIQPKISELEKVRAELVPAGR